jgi:hypothetical protein
VLRHELVMDATGRALLTWPLCYRPLHDAVLEDALDRAQHELTGVASVRPQWSPYVRLLRRAARLLQRGGGRTPSRGTAQPAAGVTATAHVTAAAQPAADVAAATPAQPAADVTATASPIEGTGVFARRAFADGDVVLTIDTSRTVDERQPLRPELGEREEHCTPLPDGRVVLLPAPERHLNHSCDPNAYLHTVADELRVVARRAIAAGDEVTLDYLINTHGGSRWQCNCGAARCRGLLEASFFDLPPALQREYLPLLEPWFAARHAARHAAAVQRLAAQPASIPEGPV